MNLSREAHSEVFPVKRGLLHQSVAVVLTAALLLITPGLPFYQAFAADEAVTTGEVGANGGLAAAPGYAASGAAPSAMTVSAQAGSFQQGVHVHLGANGAALPSGAALGSEASGLTSQGAAAPSAAALDSESAAPEAGALDSAAQSPAAALVHTQSQVQAALPDLSAVASMPAADAYDAGEKAMEPILHQYRAGAAYGASDNGVLGRSGSEGPVSATTRFGTPVQPGRTPAAAAAFAAPPAPAANGVLPAANGVLPAANGAPPAAKSGPSRIGEIARAAAGIAAGAGLVLGAQALAATLAPGVFGLVPFAAAWTLLSAVGVSLYFRPWKMRVQLSNSKTQGLGAAKLLADVALGALLGAVVVSASGLGIVGLLHIHSILINGLADILQGASAMSVISPGPLLGLMAMGVLGAESFLLPFLTGKRQPSAMAMQLFQNFLWISLCVPFALGSGFAAPSAKIVNIAFVAWNLSMSKPRINSVLNVAFLAAAAAVGFLHLPAAVTFLVLAFSGDRAVSFTKSLVNRIASKGDGQVAPGDTYVLDEESDHPPTDVRIQRLESPQISDGSKDPYHYWIKTAGWVGVIGAMFVAAAKVVGWAHVRIPLLIAAAIAGVSSWYSYKITIAIYGGIPFEQKAKDMPRLLRLKERIMKEIVRPEGIQRDIPLFFLPSDKFPGPNAFATGFDTGHAVIAVSEDCLAIMDDDEIVGVLSHEINHVVHGDIRMGAVVQTMVLGMNWFLYNVIWLVSKGETAILNGFVAPAYGLLARAGFARPAVPPSGDQVKDLTGQGPSGGPSANTMRPEVFPGVGAGAASLGLGAVFTPFLMKLFEAVWLPVAVGLVQKAYSRTREFHADEGGALLLGKHKDYLISAFKKLESWKPPKKLTPEQRMRLMLMFTLSPIMIVSPLEQYYGPVFPGSQQPPAPPAASGPSDKAGPGQPGQPSGAAQAAAPAAAPAPAAPQTPPSEGSVSLRFVPPSPIQPQGPHLTSRLTDLPPPGQVAFDGRQQSLGTQTPRGSFSSRVWDRIKDAFRLSPDGARNRSLWIFLAGQAAIVFGFQFQAVAQQELVKKDSTQLSRLGAVNSAANAAASFTTGPYVNRAPTKRTLVWSGYARAAILALFPYLFLAGHLGPLSIIGLLAMIAFTQRLSINVSKFAFIKLLAGDEASYNKAYGMSRLVSNAASILGPAIGGTMMGAAELFFKSAYGLSGGGPIFVLAVYGVLMVVSSLINQTLKIPNDRVSYLAASSSAPGNDGSWWSAFRNQVAQFAEGFRLIAANRFLWRSMILNSFDALVTSPALFLVIPVLAKALSMAHPFFAGVPVLGWWSKAMFSKEGSYGLLLSFESIGTALAAVLLMAGPGWIDWADRQRGNGLIGAFSAPLRWLGRLSGRLGGGALERQGKLTYVLDAFSDLALWGLYFSHGILAAGAVVLAMSFLNGPSNIVYDSLVNKVLETGSGELKENKAKVLSALDFIQSVMTIAGMLAVGYFMNVSAMPLLKALKWLGLIATVSSVISFVEPFLVFPLQPKPKSEAKK